MVPTQQLEQIWRSYESFEMSNTTNKTLARKILDEQKPKYQAARAVTVPRRTLLDDIDRRALAVPIGASVMLSAQWLLLFCIRILSIYQDTINAWLMLVRAHYCQH